MSVNFKIDQKASFAGTVFVGCQPKREMGSQAQAVTKDGTPKWEVEVLAAVFDNFGGTRSEILKVGMASRSNPAEGVNPFTPIYLGGLEVGVMEKTKRTQDGGERVIGVTVWYRAQEITLTGAEQSQAA